MEQKIIFSGPVGVGKTTAISAISDIPVVATEVAPTDGVAKMKKTTTVAMDYGLLHLDGNAKVHLYGTPGQERFKFMWEILSIGALGLVLLIDDTRPDPFQDMEFYLSSFKEAVSNNGVVIGVNRSEARSRPRLPEYQMKLDKLNLNLPIFEVDPRRREDVKRLMIALLAILDPAIHR